MDAQRHSKVDYVGVQWPAKDDPREGGTLKSIPLGSCGMRGPVGQSHSVGEGGECCSIMGCSRNIKKGFGIARC